MEIDQNKELVRRFIKDVLQERDAGATDELLADGFVSHTWRLQGDHREGLKKAAEMIRAGLSNVRFEIEDLIAEGDRVVARVTSSATPVADFHGIPPSGRGYEIGEIHIFRIADGRIAEHWHQYDSRGLINQLKS